MWKMRNAHIITWNMVRKLKIIENLETHTVGCKTWQDTEKGGK
jgi:hypothetical protein